MLLLSALDEGMGVSKFNLRFRTMSRDHMTRNMTIGIFSRLSILAVRKVMF